MKKMLILIFGVIALFSIKSNVFAKDLIIDNLDFSIEERFPIYYKNDLDYNVSIASVYDKYMEFYNQQNEYDYYLIYATNTNDLYLYLFNDNNLLIDNNIRTYFCYTPYKQIAFSLPNKLKDKLYRYNLSTDNITSFDINSYSGYTGLGMCYSGTSSNRYYYNIMQGDTYDYVSNLKISISTNFNNFNLDFYNQNYTVYDNIIINGITYNTSTDKIPIISNDNETIDTLTLNKLDMWKLKEVDTTKIDYIDWNMVFYYYGEQLGGNKFYMSDITLSDINNYSIYRAPIYEKTPNWEYVDTYNLEDNILNITEVDNFVVSEFNSLPIDFLDYQYKIRFNFNKDRVISFLETFDFAPFENYVDTKCIYRYFYNSELDIGDTMCYENNSFISPVADFLKDLKKIRVPKDVKYMILSSENLITEKKLISYVFPHNSRVYNYDLFNNSIIDVDDYFIEHKSHFDYYEYRKTFTENDIWYIENFSISNDFDIWVSSDVNVSFIIDNVDNEIIIDNEIIVIDKPPYNDDRFNEEGNVINDNSSQSVLSLFNSSFDAFVNTIKIIFSTIGSFFIVLPLILKQFFITIFILSILLYIFRFLV